MAHIIDSYITCAVKAFEYKVLGIMTTLTVAMFVTVKLGLFAAIGLLGNAVKFAG